MTKLEELRAALLLSADAPWMRKVHTASERYSVWAACGTDREHQIAGDMNEHNAVFIQRAHNLMPTLLEAIDLLETVSSARACQDHEFDVDAWFKQVRSLLGDLK